MTSLRLLSLCGTLICVAVVAYLYSVDESNTVNVLNTARAQVAALIPAPKSAPVYTERVKDTEFDLASRERQTQGFKAYGHQPGGEMARTVDLPENLPNGQAIAQQICAFLEKEGMYRNVESQFPSIGKTDSHAFAMSVGSTPSPLGPSYAVNISFKYSGFIRQGDPRKIIDYARSIVQKEVAARCWNSPNFNPNPVQTPDTSETAVVTDLPNEPDTAAAQAKLFQKPVPAPLQAPPASVTVAPPSPPPDLRSPSANPAPAPIANNGVPVSPGVSDYPAATSGSPTAGLKIRKDVLPKTGRGVYLNGLQYTTLDEIDRPDTSNTSKLLNQGQTDANAKGQSPLDQPADQRIKVPQQ